MHCMITILDPGTFEFNEPSFIVKESQGFAEVSQGRLVIINGIPHIRNSTGPGLEFEEKTKLNSIFAVRGKYAWGIQTRII